MRTYNLYFSILCLENHSKTSKIRYILGMMKVLKANKFLRSSYLQFRKNIATIRRLRQLPTSFFRLPTLILFVKQRNRFRRKGGVISRYFPILTDYKDSAGTASGHYFHQDLLVAKLIYQSNPLKHLDIGSRIDGFVAHVASFREIEILDIRPLSDSAHPSIKYKTMDIMSDVEENLADSISCLHSIEHFGLGRYGDQIEPDGHLIGFTNLVRMLKPGGTLYISFPIGLANEVYFNAHRVFHPLEIFNWGVDSLKLKRFDFVDDFGRLNLDVDVFANDLKTVYGCGIYTFVKI
jgi:hypothetical protein